MTLLWLFAPLHRLGASHGQRMPLGFGEAGHECQKLPGTQVIALPIAPLSFGLLFSRSCPCAAPALPQLPLSPLPRGSPLTFHCCSSLLSPTPSSKSPSPTACSFLPPPALRVSDGEEGRREAIGGPPPQLMGSRRWMLQASGEELKQGLRAERRQHSKGSRSAASSEERGAASCLGKLSLPWPMVPAIQGAGSIRLCLWWGCQRSSSGRRRRGSSWPLYSGADPFLGSLIGANSQSWMRCFTIMWILFPSCTWGWCVGGYSHRFSVASMTKLCSISAAWRKEIVPSRSAPTIRAVNLASTWARHWSWEDDLPPMATSSQSPATVTVTSPVLVCSQVMNSWEKKSVQINLPLTVKSLQGALGV
nr:uncharacterized protein LOC116830652 [Chelonoidis abingdonii]